jgi:hypothetical protein
LDHQAEYIHYLTEQIEELQSLKGAGLPEQPAITRNDDRRDEILRRNTPDEEMPD